MEQEATLHSGSTLSLAEITKKEIKNQYPRRARKKKGKAGNLPPFVPLTWEMLNSHAYKELPPSTAKALPYFLGKVQTSYNDPQKYLTDFSFSYKEARRYGFANATHNRSISALISKGFIDPIDKGGLRGGGLSCSLFRLSERWKEYGTKEFRHAQNWQSFMPKGKSKRNINNGNLQHQKRNENDCE